MYCDHLIGLINECLHKHNLRCVSVLRNNLTIACIKKLNYAGIFTKSWNWMAVCIDCGSIGDTSEVIFLSFSAALRNIIKIKCVRDQKFIREGGRGGGCGCIDCITEKAG